MRGLTTIHKKRSIELIASTSSDSIDVPLQNCSREEGNVTRDNKQAKQLSERLRIVEEETKMLKAVFWVAIQERSKLMTEVHEQVHNCLLLRDQQSGLKFFDQVSTMKSSEEMQAGMLQLLRQDSNPLLLNRNISIKAATYIPPTRTYGKNVCHLNN